MQRIDSYVTKAKASNSIQNRMKRVMPVLSLVVVLSVFWTLKLTGITMAGEAFCGKDEHIHTEDCGPPVLICTEIETEGHLHTEQCIAKHLICTEEIVIHTHEDACYSETMICEMEESEEHTHDSNCYQVDLICELDEVSHTHIDSCYQMGNGFICLQEHQHTAECINEETELICGSEIIEPHIHTEICYEQTECLVEEHIHTAACYSNIQADLETQYQWEETLPGIVENARAQDNILAIAQSQLGYTESSLNFIVDENDTKYGYTRYGQWYGNPYGNWNTMFVSFCLHYAQVEDIPLSSGAETMRLEWESAGIYHSKEDVNMQPGDLVYLDKNMNGSADAVAIIVDYQDGEIHVIEGDLDNMVKETTYLDTDEIIMGYGVIPNIQTMSLSSERVLPIVGKTYNFNGSNIYNNDVFIVYTQSGGNYYAIDNNANAVPIYIDSAGNVTADVANRNTIYWRFESANSYENQPSFYIRNVANDNIYIHPYNNNSANGAAIIAERWESALYRNNNGARIRGARQNAYIQLQNNSRFNQVNNQNSGSVMYFAKSPETRTVWLDGTDGGLRVYAGSQNTSYTFYEGEIFTLPTEWRSPSKYSYKLQGWYDVINGVYYAPGAEAKVSGNMVFYADWIAETYDIGEYNAQTINTESSNEFITTKVFDYGYLFNVMSQNAQVSVSSSGHTEKWSMVHSGKVKYKNMTTLDYMFLDWHGDSSLTLPSDRNDRNTANGVYEGLLTDELEEILFSTENSFDPKTGEGIIGKTYLGEGDYLFQYNTDPNHPHYGYYYYDSRLNAASYNQSKGRFYVYDYLAATSDSLGNESYSDYLPMNSPYANTQSNSVSTYTYAGENGEYNGVTHYRYEIGSSSNAMANCAFGTSMEVRFHLPYKPGEKDDTGEYGNTDLFGNQMQFEFAGDDDLWVLVDGELVLDLGGIHQIEAGSINFATGVVTVNGTEHHTITNIESGEHVMQIYYLERGSSQSNCVIYFNLAPRYSLNIQKEDVLTQDLLDGTQFEIFEDYACTQKASLWTSSKSYMNGDPSEERFTVTNGSVDIWGLCAGSTYYIKEVTPPLKEGYNLPKGIIKFSIDKKGIATYDVEVLEELDENGNSIKVSPGFTVHGVHINEEHRKAYITITNAEHWVKDTTTVQVGKIWDDDVDHSEDYVTVYLTVTDPNGTVRRIREVILSAENNWNYMWTGLPKFLEDQRTLVKYGIDEAYEEGYYSSSMKVDKIEIDTSQWAEAVEFESENKYLLKSNKGYLSTTSESANNFKWVDEKTAKSSPLAQWNAIVNNNNQMNLKNDAGQIITLNTSGGTKYVASKTSGNYQTLTLSDTGNGFTFSVYYRYNNYYMGDINNSGGSITAQTGSNNAIVFVPMTLVEDKEVIEIKDLGFKITNTPLEEETSLTVNKKWDTSYGGYGGSYQEELVTVKLFANGIDTGRTVTLMLKNNWTDTFRGLPYKDENGDVIVYTVVEVWTKDNWIVSYGEIVSSKDEIPKYSTTVTNVYIPMGPALPSTGNFGRLLYLYCGGGLMLLSLIIALRLRRDEERRKK